MGFDADQALTPYPRRSFAAYRLLQEYFAFPAKFFFIDLAELDILADTEFGPSLELVFLFSSFERADRVEALEGGVSAQSIRLACAPAVNLFEQTAEPIALDQTHYEHQVIPNRRRRDDVEVFSIDRVTAGKPGGGATSDLPAFLFLSPRRGRARKDGLLADCEARTVRTQDLRGRGAHDSRQRQRTPRVR